MKFVNPNVPNWFVEVPDSDKKVIQDHLDAGWQKVSPKRTSAKAAKAANETSSDDKAEGETKI